MVEEEEEPKTKLREEPEYLLGDVLNLPSPDLPHPFLDRGEYLNQPSEPEDLPGYHCGSADVLVLPCGLQDLSLERLDYERLRLISFGSSQESAEVLDGSEHLSEGRGTLSLPEVLARRFTRGLMISVSDMGATTL